MKAAEAARLSQEMEARLREERAKEQLNAIRWRIDAAIANGERRASLVGEVASSVEVELRRDGYSVRVISANDAMYHTIIEW